MWKASIRELARQEQSRQCGKLVIGIDLDNYIDKLLAKAEFLSHVTMEQCLGFVAFYCNDHATREAYISLFIVAPQARRTGLGHALLNSVAVIARGRGFASLALRVRKDNHAAIVFYERYGFSIRSEERFDLVLKREL